MLRCFDYFGGFVVGVVWVLGWVWVVVCFGVLVGIDLGGVGLGWVGDGGLLLCLRCF